jgi:nucleoside-diphosphate-sugar epimerase
MAFSTQTSREVMRRVLANPLLRHAKASIEEATPKQIALSGPAGFLGSRVLSSILDAHDHRRAVGLEPGEVVLLSSSPGNLMSRLINKHGHARMASVRATRVDYYFQHDLDSWRDQLGSLGMGGSDAVFVNLAALAGPRADRPDAMMAVNYRAPLAAARACEALGFGHWIQSSTQAVKAERAGQVPYSRWKAMADYSLARLERLPVSVMTLGLLYCKNSGVVGQKGDTLNMVDLALLPITPIMGNGRAPLQPLEVDDAAARIAYLALTEPTARPVQATSFATVASKRASADTRENSTPQTPSSAASVPGWYEKKCEQRHDWARPKIEPGRQYTWRTYDAVGPETMTLVGPDEDVRDAQRPERYIPSSSITETLKPCSTSRRLGNLNRQFVSLLRSEQDAERPIVGNPETFETLLGPNAKLFRMRDALYEEDEISVFWFRTAARG